MSLFHQGEWTQAVTAKTTHILTIKDFKDACESAESALVFAYYVIHGHYQSWIDTVTNFLHRAEFSAFCGRNDFI